MLIFIIFSRWKHPSANRYPASQNDRGCSEKIAKYMIRIQAGGGTTPTFH
jgi:hypothetical protein